MPPLKRKRRNNNDESIITKSSPSIIDLNDDCLFNVFNYLSSLDMCAVKDTCRRFCSVAESHMDFYYKSKQVVLSDRTTADSNNLSNQMKVFFKFCAVLSNLEISVLDMNWHDENAVNVFSTIRKFNPNLKELTLTSMNFDLALSRLPKTFSKLRKIKLEFDYHESVFEYDIKREEKIKDIYKACKNVEDISFGASVRPMGCRYQTIFLQQKFKKLHSLELYDVRDIDMNSLNVFLKLNPNLKRLILKNCVRFEQLSEISFVKNAPNIEGVAVSFNLNEHTIYDPFVKAFELTKLEKLKFLAIDVCDAPIEDFITSLAQRNSLHFLNLTKVSHKINRGLAKTFCNMNNLKILHLSIRFYGYVDGLLDFYKILCTNLVNLIELYLNDSYLDFQQICDIVEYSKNLKKLYLPLRYDELSEDDYVVLVEKRLLLIPDEPLTLFLNYHNYAAAIFLIPNNTLLENGHIIKLAKFDPLNYEDFWLPSSV